VDNLNFVRSRELKNKILIIDAHRALTRHLQTSLFKTFKGRLKTQCNWFSCLILIYRPSDAPTT